MQTIASHSLLNISETVRDRRLVPISKVPPTGNGVWVSDGHLTGDVT